MQSLCPRSSQGWYANIDAQQHSVPKLDRQDALRAQKKAVDPRWMWGFKESSQQNMEPLGATMGV